MKITSLISLLFLLFLNINVSAQKVQLSAEQQISRSVFHIQKYFNIVDSKISKKNFDIFLKYYFFDLEEILTKKDKKELFHKINDINEAVQGKNSEIVLKLNNILKEKLFLLKQNPNPKILQSYRQIQLEIGETPSRIENLTTNILDQTIQSILKDLDAHFYIHFLNSTLKTVDPNAGYYSSTSNFSFPFSKKDKTFRKSQKKYSFSDQFESDRIIAFKSHNKNSWAYVNPQWTESYFKKQIQKLNHQEIDFLFRTSDNDEYLLTWQLKTNKNTANVKLSWVLGKQNKIAHLTIPSFYANKTSTLEKDLKNKLNEVIAGNGEGLILDLRNSKGGHVEQAVKSLSFFINKQPILLSRNGNQTIKKSTYSDKVLWNKPVVVLINEGTASSSEIFAAAFQDYKKGILVGTKTYGKASMQDLIDINDFLESDFDYGKIKVTTALCYRVTGQSFQQIGISPDIFVDNNEIETIHKMNEWQNFPNIKNEQKAVTQENEKIIQRLIQSFDTNVSIDPKSPIDPKLQAAIEILNQWNNSLLEVK